MPGTRIPRAAPLCCFGFHPTGYCGVLGPENDNTAGRVQCALNDLVKRLSRRNLPVPPNGPTPYRFPDGIFNRFYFFSKSGIESIFSTTARRVPSSTKRGPRPVKPSKKLTGSRRETSDTAINPLDPPFGKRGMLSSAKSIVAAFCSGTMLML